jgi:hypothetical protein
MAFSNPLVLTINSVAKNLAKINTDNFGSEYLLIESLSEFRAKIRHSRRTNKGIVYDRHNIEIVETVYATSTVPEFDRKVYLVLENKKGDSTSSLEDIGDAFSALLNTAAYTNLVSWQN